MSSLSLDIAACNRLQQALDYVLLVENRELHRDPWQVCETGNWLGSAVLAMLVIEVDEDVAVHSIASQQNQNNEIGMSNATSNALAR